MQSLLMAGSTMHACMQCMDSISCSSGYLLLRSLYSKDTLLYFPIPFLSQYPSPSTIYVLGIPHSKRFLQRWSLLMTASPAQEYLYKHSLHIIGIPLSPGSLVEHTTLQWSCFQTPHQEWTPTCTARNQTIYHVRMRCRVLDNSLTKAISCKSSAVHTYG